MWFSYADMDTGFLETFILFIFGGSFVASSSTYLLIPEYLLLFSKSYFFLDSLGAKPLNISK